MHPLQQLTQSFTTLAITVVDRVALLQLTRGDAFNTMNEDFWRELPQALDALNAAADVRALVISSTGKHFSAGMDLQVFAGLDGPEFQLEASRRAERIRRLVLELQSCFSRFEALRMPVLAAIQGGCIGGGVDMVAAADCRYATADCYFTIKEIDLAMTADLGTLQRLPRLMPQGLVRELAFTGRRFTAAEALQYGFVNAVYPDQQQMLDAVMAKAKDIAAHSPLAIHGTKEMLNYARDHTLDDSLRYMAVWQSGMFHATEVQEAMMSQFEKRTPQFEDLQPTQLKLTQPKK